MLLRNPQLPLGYRYEGLTLVRTARTLAASTPDARTRMFTQGIMPSWV